jgi:hypothetical protein
MLTTYNEVDMTEVMALRDEYKDLFLKNHGVNLGFNRNRLIFIGHGLGGELGGGHASRSVHGSPCSVRAA